MMNHGHKEYLICQEHNCYGLSKFPKYEENGTCPKCEIEQLRAKVAELEAKLAKYQNLEPVAKNWSVFSGAGAEVWSGLSLSDAAIELTEDRLERGWCAVCVLNKENLPLYALEK